MAFCLTCGFKGVRNNEILILIGYSFPFFNRKVDREIFNELKSSGVFKKIYFQDLNNSGEFLRSQFDLSKDIKIEHINNT
ncbi:MAG: hypothetical protein BRD50_04955 [Bacteroidetes bacterium SW_11_45_7]|nr:MAG: hypothetical protein BRD50_04955 [Bacteroidetes bacterium SW_11_45_7]